MFENDRDTIIFRDTLISAKRLLDSKQGSEEKNSIEDEVLELISSTVSSLSHNLYGVNNVHELFANQLDFNRRCHTVIFINLLKSHNITCMEASVYYESVIYDIPFLNWHFYLKLNHACNWNEYFIECAQQLPPYALTVILKNILDVSSDELKYYIWHLVMQSYIWKTFYPYNPAGFHADNFDPFCFDFETAEQLPNLDEIQDYIMKNSKTGHLPLVYNEVLEKISLEINQAMNIDVIKVIFHAFKTLFELVHSINDSEGPCMEKLKQLTPIFIKCLVQDEAKMLIIKALKDEQKCMMDSSYLIASWDIGERYLIFILLNYWKDFAENISYLSKPRSIPVSISDYRSEFCQDLKEKNISYKNLASLIEDLLKDSDDFSKKYLLLLSNVIRYHYPYASRAHEYLLRDPNIWEEFHVLDLQEENLTVLNPFETHSVLADAIVTTDSKQNKEKLLNNYYKILSNAPTEIYNCAIKNILEKWGFCEHFILPDCDTQLQAFKINFASLKETTETLLPLFVQSPKKMLHILIEEAIRRGSDGIQLIQVLQNIPVVCYNEIECSLLLEISLYLEDEITEKVDKHFIPLLKALMKIEASEDILPFDLFVAHFICPNLQDLNVEMLSFILECLTVSMNTLLEEQALEISADNYTLLIFQLGQIINTCIEHGTPKLKESVIFILEQLATYKKRPKLDTIFNVKEDDIKRRTFGEHTDVVIIYFLATFFKQMSRDDSIEKMKIVEWVKVITDKNFEALFTWCCLTEEIYLLASEPNCLKVITYVNILEVLTQSVLWHFSGLEWTNSVFVVRELLWQTKTLPEYPWFKEIDIGPTLSSTESSKFPSESEFARLWYGSFRCLMDCLTIMIQEKSKSSDTVRISQCFADVLIKKCTLDESCPFSLVNVYLDVCYLLTLLDPSVLYRFMPFFNNANERYSTYTGIEDLEKYTAGIFFKLGLEKLPECQAKDVLKNNFVNTFVNVYIE